MVPRVFLRSVTSTDLTELIAYFDLEGERNVQAVGAPTEQQQQGGAVAPLTGPAALHKLQQGFKVLARHKKKGRR
jgi:hypothetical protein